MQNRNLQHILHCSILLLILFQTFFYVCTEYVSIIKCYIYWCNSPMMGDKNTKNMKYILNCQLLSISIIDYPCLNRPGCNTCQCNECNGTCNTMVTNFLNLLWMVVVWFRFNLIQVIGAIGGMEDFIVLLHRVYLRNIKNKRITWREGDRL